MDSHKLQIELYEAPTTHKGSKLWIHHQELVVIIEWELVPSSHIYVPIAIKAEVVCNLFKGVSKVSDKWQLFLNCLHLLFYLHKLFILDSAER
mmetsp:Transcript_6711/g.5980  ORF Transcript_6711/g.5980 Transcript_6711/m.5980 type:complete len:93 (-) Transcript_6711:74-352(-)